MLQNLTGAPLLAWMVRLMRDSGYARFGLCCPEEFQEKAGACFPEESLISFGPQAKGPELRAFLEEAGEDLLVVTAPALLGGRALGGVDAVAGEAGEDPSVDEGCLCYLVSGESLSAVCDAANFDLGRFASVLGRELTVADGAMAIPDMGTLADMQSIFKRLRNYYLFADGVEIWDFDNCYVGPFAYIRPNCTVGDDIKVGDFVELKNSTIGDGTKISHLTYVGDTDLGKNINLGCGTVTVNYDGKNKYRCTVEDNCFIGCNTNLIAPVTVGKGSYIAAGSTITDPVPEEALAIARARQTVKPGWAARRRRDGRLK